MPISLVSSERGDGRPMRKRQAAADNGISSVGTGGTLAEASLRQREVCNARFAVLLMGS